MTANEITARLLIEIPKQFPFIRVWRNNRIDAMAVGRNGKQRRVSAGIDGQGDITGIIGAPLQCPHAGVMSIEECAACMRAGRRLEIEVKAGKDRMRPSQIAFSAMILHAGGVYFVASSVEQGLSDLRKSIA